MTVFNRSVCALATALVLCAPLPLAAQSDEDEQDQTGGDAPAAESEDSEGPNDNDSSPSITAPRSQILPGAADRTTTTTTVTTTTVPGSVAATNASVISSIEAISTYCKLGQSGVYTVDCLSERLGELAKELKGQEEFGEVREILETTSAKLNRVARKNRSTSRPVAKFSTQGKAPIETSRVLIPVDEARLDTAVAEALSIIDDAQTLLLRSSQGSGSQAIQYQRIASAIGSNKVLLRSL